MAPGATSVRTPSLRFWRTRRVLLQRELAERARVSLISVQRAEADEPLRLVTVRKLAAALDVEAADLMALPPQSSQEQPRYLRVAEDANEYRDPKPGA